MKLAIRNSDIRLASPLWPLLWLVPSQVISNGQTYQSWVSKMPAWLLPFAIGFAVASYVWDPFQKDSRLRQLWHLLTDSFEVSHLGAGHWSPWDGQGPMPDTDIGVRVRIRFRRDVSNADLRLRIFSCTGRKRKPFEKVIRLGIVNAAKGETRDIPIVDIGIPEPGWDHIRKRGWGPTKDTSLITGSRNVVVIECKRGWLTQKHHVFIALVSHVGKHAAPRIYVQDEADAPFDTSETALTGMWKYAP